jgi:hypothetical protein
MAKRAKRVRALVFRQIIALVIGTIAGGLGAVFFYHFLKHYVHYRVAMPVAVGVTVMLTFYTLNLLKLQGRTLSRVPGWVVGVFAAVGVHLSLTWLR